MLIVETVVRIRREHAAGKAIKAIARDLRLSRKVVRKAIRAEEGAFSYQRTTQPFPKIGPVRERLEQLLVENEARPRRDRLKLTRVWDLLVREGYDGSYCSVRRYAARWREETKVAPSDGGTAGRRDGVCAADFSAGRGVPVRLQPRGRGDRRPAHASEGGPCSPVRVAGDLSEGLSTRDPGDGV
jgi:hypothetical protein